jgi:glycosyltransferase involved in cell wall biosynthesis
MKRIGIDARLLNYRRGMGNVLYNYLSQLAILPPEFEYVLFTDSPATRLPFSLPEHFHIVPMQPGFYPFWEQVLLPKKAHKLGVNLLHCLANTGPLFLPSNIKLVVTINDVMFLLPQHQLPGSRVLFQQLGRIYRSFVVPKVARRADKIITISQYSKSDILRLIDVPSTKVEVAYLAPGVRSNTNTFATQPLPEIPYLMALGATDPRKNTRLVMEVFARLSRDGRFAGQLRLVGLPEKYSAELRELAQTLKIESQVLFYDFVSESELAHLYHGSTAFLYPSLYEGFGLPVLEAMSYGAPVITSNTTSIPEVAGDAALLVNPTSADELYSATSQLLSNPDLRQQLIQRGYAQAARFSWQEMTHAYLALYREVLE